MAWRLRAARRAAALAARWVGVLVDRGLHDRQAANQHGANLRELVGREQRRSESRAASAWRRGDAGMFGFELDDRALQRRDLLAQRAAMAGLRRASAGRSLLGGAGGRRDVQRGGDLAWVDARLARGSRGCGRDRAHGRRRAEAQATNVPLPCWLSIRPSLLQALVDGAHRVDVQADRLAPARAASAAAARARSSPSAIRVHSVHASCTPSGTSASRSIARSQAPRPCASAGGPRGWSAMREE